MNWSVDIVQMLCKSGVVHVEYHEQVQELSFFFAPLVKYASSSLLLLLRQNQPLYLLMIFHMALGLQTLCTLTIWEEDNDPRTGSDAEDFKHVSARKTMPRVQEGDPKYFSMKLSQRILNCTEPVLKIILLTPPISCILN